LHTNYSFKNKSLIFFKSSRKEFEFRTVRITKGKAEQSTKRSEGIAKLVLTGSEFGSAPFYEFDISDLSEIQMSKTRINLPSNTFDTIVT